MPVIARPRARLLLLNPTPPLKASKHRQVAELCILAAISVGIAFSTSAASAAPAGTGLAHCPTLEDALTRLSCFDAVAKQAGLEKDGLVAFPQMDLVAFKAGRSDLLTKPVRLSGRLGILGPFAALRNPDRIDNDPVWISIDRLKPERWKAIAAECARRCMVTIEGRVSHVFSGIGVAAEVIEVESP